MWFARERKLNPGAPVRASRADQAERRSHPRIPNPPLLVNCWAARVADVSLGGISLVLDSSQAAGEPFQLLLTDGLYHFTQDLAAELVWQEGNQVGLRWVDLSPAQEKWLCGCFSRWRREPLSVLVSTTRQ